MPSSVKLIFFGNERLATSVTTTCPTLRGLIESGYEVKAVVSSYSQASSRKQRNLEIEEQTSKHTIPLMLPERLSEVRDDIAAIKADIGILVAYGKIVPQSIIDLFPLGIINLHPSLLPLHRGPIPLESVILEGASETGMSLMSLVRQMDAGPIYAQAKIKLSGQESKQQLADRLLELGSNTLLKTLPNIISGETKPVPQNEADATYDTKLTKDLGLVNWSQPAAQIERQVRAFLGWPGSQALLYGRDVTLTATHVGDTAHMSLVDNQAPGVAFKTTANELAVTTGHGELIIERLIPNGKREMTGSEFMAGQRL